MDVKKFFEDQLAKPQLIPFLKQRFNSRRMGVMTGAGISMPSGCPSWAKLVEAVRSHTQEPKDHLKDFSNSSDASYLTEIAFRRFCERNNSSDETDGTEDYRQAKVDAAWLEIVKKELYKDVTAELIRDHPYIENLAKLVQGCNFNINFNFDTILDQVVATIATGKQQTLPAVTWKIPNISKPDSSTILHINGIAPREKNKKSTQLIFSEDSFARVLSSPDARQKEYILRQLADNTFILLGLSLKDNSLCSILKSSQERSPGCHHIYIYYVSDQSTLTQEEKQDIFNVNLYVYNLITLFLDNNGVNEFLGVISCQGDVDFTLDLRRSSIEETYLYYIVGCPASGKTTLLENLRCFYTIEEWTQPLPPTMHGRFDKLTEEEQRDVDRFLDTELIKKDKIATSMKTGFVIMDRAPLDLFAFSTAPEENMRKVNQVKTITNNGVSDFSKGHIIFLEASASELALRQAKRGRANREMNYTGDDLVAQGQKLKEIYDPPLEQVFDNSFMNPERTALRVARHILLTDYKPVVINDILARVEESAGHLGLGKYSPENGTSDRSRLEAPE